MKTRENLDAIVGDVQHDQSRKVPRRESFGARAERSAFRQFVDAVLAFSVDPGPANLERYLAASRSLEESRLDGVRRRLVRGLSSGNQVSGQGSNSGGGGYG